MISGDYTGQAVFARSNLGSLFLNPVQDVDLWAYLSRGFEVGRLHPRTDQLSKDLVLQSAYRIWTNHWKLSLKRVCGVDLQIVLLVGIWDSIGKLPSDIANSRWNTQDIPHILRNQKFVSVFTRARQCFLLAEQSNPHPSYLFNIQIWCDFDRASSLVCGNKMPAWCNRGFCCRSYWLLNMFRAPLCPSSGAQEYYTVVAACGISCCGFSSCWSGVELRVICPVCRMLQHPANRTHNPDDGHSGARNMLSKQ